MAMKFVTKPSRPVLKVIVGVTLFLAALCLGEMFQREFPAETPVAGKPTEKADGSQFGLKMIVGTTMMAILTICVFCHIHSQKKPPVKRNPIRLPTVEEVNATRGNNNN